jgi:hypothetical protein
MAAPASAAAALDLREVDNTFPEAVFPPASKFISIQKLLIQSLRYPDAKPKPTPLEGSAAGWYDSQGCASLLECNLGCMLSMCMASADWKTRYHIYIDTKEQPCRTYVRALSKRCSLLPLEQVRLLSNVLYPSQDASALADVTCKLHHLANRGQRLISGSEHEFDFVKLQHGCIPLARRANGRG